jgi:hypothetical protein
MTEPADPPAFRHATVYRTVRGLTLSGGREAAGAVYTVAQPPLRVGEMVRVQRRADPDAGDAVDTVAARARAAPEIEPVQDDSTALFERRRYSEPND